MRNDVVMQKLNVKFVSTGVNDYFKFLGPSHCSGRDDVKLMNLIKMKVYDPYTAKNDFHELVNEWLRDKNSGYLRV